MELFKSRVKWIMNGMSRYRQKNKIVHMLNSSWAPLAVGFFVILIILGIRVFQVEKKCSEGDNPGLVINPPIAVLKDTLENVLTTQHIVWKAHQRQNKVEVWTVNVPVYIPVPSLHLEIQNAIRKADAKIIGAMSDPITGHVSLDIGWQDSCFLQIVLAQTEASWSEQGNIGLIIDDFGHQWNSVVQSFLDFGNLITISVIPGEKYSEKIALEGAKKGCEVILHLPMEPISANYKMNEYIVLYKMGRHKIRDVIQRSLKSVPGVVGVNNHMGSRVTSDRETIIHVMEELKVRSLYFIDSRTIAESVAFDVARDMGVPCDKRDVFFDLKLNPQSIRSNLSKLASKAKANGNAIGIGHCHEMTLQVLQEEIEHYQKKGYRFRKISYLVQ